MDTWTKQASFPVLTLSRGVGINKQFTVTQESFIEAKHRHDNNVTTLATTTNLWQIPFTYITDESLDPKTTWLKSKGSH